MHFWQQGTSGAVLQTSSVTSSSKVKLSLKAPSTLMTPPVMLLLLLVCPHVGTPVHRASVSDASGCVLHQPAAIW
jgi:hypothetical protein